MSNDTAKKNTREDERDINKKVCRSSLLSGISTYLIPIIIAFIHLYKYAYRVETMARRNSHLSRIDRHSTTVNKPFLSRSRALITNDFTMKSMQIITRTIEWRFEQFVKVSITEFFCLSRGFVMEGDTLLRVGILHAVRSSDIQRLQEYFQEYEKFLLSEYNNYINNNNDNDGGKTASPNNSTEDASVKERMRILLNREFYSDVGKKKDHLLNSAITANSLPIVSRGRSY